MAVPLPSKAKLRADLKGERDRRFAGLTPADRCAAAVMLRQTVLRNLDRARCIAAYLPIGSEIDPVPLVDVLAAEGGAIALPHVTGRRNPMRFLTWAPGETLVAGPMGLLQPTEDARECRPDCILTPLLGFDRSRNRIGYGAGFYDRAFRALPDACRIGLAWSWQQCDVVPTEPWDVPLDAVATEKEWIA